ncbi:MAG: hypothetical protein E6Q88_04445 [Lysobacteraceae bacterium]|nr:MAG: hypothetical protein E6Q88_04445 [Xanthomonadaceae bacterium]
MGHDREHLVAAARDTLMNIAALSGTAAKHVRPGHSLVVDLGLGESELAVLANYQNDLGGRLRHDGRPTSIDADDLIDCMVLDVLGLILERALSLKLEESELVALIMASRAELRGPPR